MKFLFDLFPIILFFVSFSWAEKNITSAQAIADRYLSVFTAGQGTFWNPRRKAYGPYKRPVQYLLYQAGG